MNAPMRARCFQSPFSRGSALLLVLWMVILLGIAGLSYTASVQSQTAAMRVSRGHIEALWAARAGIERARAELMNADLDNLKPDDPIFGDRELFADQPVGPAKFSLVIPPIHPGDSPAFGLVDESARVNINSAEEDQLKLLPGMTQEMLDSLIDWRDNDATARPDGAEDDYYEELDAPYAPRNAPLLSLRELLRVRGWGAVLRQIHPDPYARFSGKPPEATSPLRIEDARDLMGMITVWSSDDSKAPDGQDRFSLSSAAADAMRQRINGLTQDEAQAIEAWRQGHQYSKTTDLLDVTRPAANNNQGGARGGGSNNGGNINNNSGGRAGGAARGAGGEGANNGARVNDQGNAGNQESTEKTFTLARTGELIDWFSADESSSSGAKPGRINVNTASRGVLMTVPGMTDAVADAIVSQRASGGFAGAGEIASLNGVDADLFKQAYPYLTARSSRFHVWSRGVEPDSGVAATIECVLATADGDAKVVYWREE